MLALRTLLNMVESQIEGCISKKLRLYIHWILNTQFCEVFNNLQKIQKHIPKLITCQQKENPILIMNYSLLSYSFPIAITIWMASLGLISWPTQQIFRILHEQS